MRWLKIALVHSILSDKAGGQYSLYRSGKTLCRSPHDSLTRRNSISEQYWGLVCNSNKPYSSLLPFCGPFSGLHFAHWFTLTNRRKTFVGMKFDWNSLAEHHPTSHQAGPLGEEGVVLLVSCLCPCEAAKHRYKGLNDFSLRGSYTRCPSNVGILCYF